MKIHFDYVFVFMFRFTTTEMHNAAATVAGSKRGGGRGGRLLLAHILFKKTAFPCKRHFVVRICDK